MVMFSVFILGIHLIVYAVSVIGVKFVLKVALFCYNLRQICGCHFSKTI